MLDPYALAVSGGQRWGAPDIPHGQSKGRLPRRGRVVIEEFDWEDDMPPATPLGKTVLYGHVRELRDIPRPASSIPAPTSASARSVHLQALGVTAVQLMPVLIR